MKLETICKIIQEIEDNGASDISVKLCRDGILVRAEERRGILVMTCAKIIPFTEADSVSDDLLDSMIRDNIDVCAKAMAGAKS